MIDVWPYFQIRRPLWSLAVWVIAAFAGGAAGTTQLPVWRTLVDGVQGQHLIILPSNFAPLALVVVAVGACSVGAEPLGDLAVSASRRRQMPRLLTLSLMSAYVALSAIGMRLIYPWHTGVLVSDATILFSAALLGASFVGRRWMWIGPAALLMLQLLPLGLPQWCLSWAYDGLGTTSRLLATLALFALAVVFDIISSVRPRPLLLRANTLRQLAEAADA